jgi:protein involved in sex pheromone biosynthesis
MRKFAVLAVSAAVFALSACNAPAEDATVTEEVATEEVVPAEDAMAPEAMTTEEVAPATDEAAAPADATAAPAEEEAAVTE